MGSPIPLLFREAAHFRADLQLVEASFQHAVGMEIDLAPVKSLQESEIRKELDDLGVKLRFMDLYGAAQFTSVVFQLAAGGIEGLTNRFGKALPAPGDR